ICAIAQQRLSGQSPYAQRARVSSLLPSRRFCLPLAAWKDCAWTRSPCPQFRRWQCQIPAWQAGRDRADVWPRTGYAIAAAVSAHYIETETLPSRARHSIKESENRCRCENDVACRGTLAVEKRHEESCGLQPNVGVSHIGRAWLCEV